MCGKARESLSSVMESGLLKRSFREASGLAKARHLHFEASKFVRGGTRRAQSKLHGDGIFGVAGDVPAGILRGMGEERVRAGHVFLGLQSVHLVLGFVAFVGDSKKASAVYGTGGAA